MNISFRKRPIALAIATVLGSAAMVAAPEMAIAEKVQGNYVSGDFHNHTTCSDGSISMQKLVKKVTDKVDTPWGLDWFVQAGHGGNGNRNCTLVEDATLDTPAYPYVAGKGPTTTWANSIGSAALKGDNAATNGNMWRWQSIQEFQYPLIEYLSVVKDVPLFIGMESVVAGHEHTSMSVVTGQMPKSLDDAIMPSTPGGQNFATAVGNATALAQWSYCFDRGDTDTSRGANNNWNCAVTGSLNAADPNWNATAQKLANNTGNAGHQKTLEALKWMKEFHPKASYYVPAHLERAGPFNPNGANGFNIEHLRNFNNTAPDIAFGFETQPGHGAANNRGEYQVKRNTFDGVKVDSVGGTTYGGTGVYGAQIGGVWDALLGEGRRWWFFASSDWHNRGQFGPDDRRSTQDFFPGEYQRTYVMVRKHDEKLRPQNIVNGLRSGNAFSTSGQLIDRLAFVACVGNPAKHGHDHDRGHGRSESAVEALAVNAAKHNKDLDFEGCATMGEKLVVPKGSDIVVAIVARDPDGTNYSPYTFPNPSLLQVGINQPLNMPVLDHIDVIRGLVSGFKTPGSADYAGEWPRNTNWLRDDGTTADLSVVPAAAKNTTAALYKTFDKRTWATVPGHPEYKSMVFRIPAVQASQYVRLRGTNLPPSVPYETDANGNPLSDLYTNSNDKTKLRIACTTPHSANSQFDGCPDHLAVATSPTTGPANPIAGQKAVSFDIAAWSDLWFYSNPIYVEVGGSTKVAGIK